MTRIQASLLAVVVLIGGLLSLSVQAADNTWDAGLNADNSDWNTAANWGLDSVPTGADTAFFTNTATVFANPILDSGESVLGLRLNFGDWTLGVSGGTLSIGSGGIISNHAGASELFPHTNTIQFPIVMTADQTWAASEEEGDGAPFHHLIVNGTIDTAGFELELEGYGIITLNGVISGTGDLDVNGGGDDEEYEGEFFLNGNNTYSGTTWIDGGELYVGHDNAFGTSVIDIDGGTLVAGTTLRTIANDMTWEDNFTFGDGSKFLFTGDVILNEDITVTTNNTGDVEFSGEIDLDGNDLTFTGPDNTRIILSGTVIDSDETLYIENQVTVELTETGVIGEDDSFVPVFASSESTFILNGTVWGTVTIRENATLEGDGFINGDLELENAGEFGPILNPGNSVGTMNVAGDFLLGEATTLVIEFNTADGNDLVDVGGEAVLESDDDDSQIFLTQLDDDFVADGRMFTVITTGDGVTNEGVDINDDGDGHLGSDFFEAYNLFVTVTGGAVGDDFVLTAHREPYAEEANSGNNAAIAEALDADVADGVTPGSDLNELTNFLDYSSDEPEDEDFDDFNSNLTFLSPEPYGAPNDVAFGDARNYHQGLFGGNMYGMAAAPKPAAASATAGFQFASSMNDPAALNYAIQQAQLAAAAPAGGAARPAGAAAATPAKPATKPAATPLVPGNPPAGTAQFFARGYGIFGEREAQTDRVGYDADTYGGLLGLVYSISQNFQAGIALGYSTSDIDILGGGNHDMDNIRVGPFASWTNDKVVVDVAASLGLHMVDSTRVTPGGTAIADFDSFDFSVYAKVGMIFQAGKCDVMPFVSIDLSLISQDSFSETGASPFNLNVASNDATFARGTVGVKISRVVQLGSFSLVPEGFIGYAQEFGDDNDISASFAAGGTPFTVKSGVGDDGNIVGGAAVTALVNPKTSLFIEWTGQFGGEFEAHAFSGGLRIRF